jgi:uncharacterized ion transporter superfamily protein YfcC
MHIYLLSSLVLLGITVLTWIPKLATTPMGILDIIPAIFKTAQDKIFKLSGNGLTTLALAFLIYAFLESKVLQNLFASQQEKWKKSQRPWVMVSILTIFASLMSTTSAWYDEFILLYPLMVPLFLSLGLDTFTALLCFFGGSSAGLLGIVSPQWIGEAGNGYVNPHVKSKEYEIKGTSGMDFRIAVWLIFTTIVVLFNIWYCSKIYQKPVSKTPQKPLLEIKKEPKKPKFTGRQGIILAVFGIFLIGSILGQLNFFASDKAEKTRLCDNNPYVSSSFAKEEKYLTVGEVVSEESGVEPVKIAKVIEPKPDRKAFWKTFGKWKGLQDASWCVIGGIIICLLSKQNIAVCLVKSAQKAIPIIFAYLLVNTAVTIAKEAGMPGQIKNLLLSDKVTTQAGTFALFTIFFVFLLISIFSPGIVPAIFTGIVPALAAISVNTLLYGFLIMMFARMLACTFSPFSAILLTSLETNKISYKEYIKKTWILWLLVFLVALGLISFYAFTCN